MIPNFSTPREKPDRSVNMMHHSSPKRSQIRSSILALSAPGLRRSSISLARRASEAPLRIDLRSSIVAGVYLRRGGIRSRLLQRALITTLCPGEDRPYERTFGVGVVLNILPAVCSKLPLRH